MGNSMCAMCNSKAKTKASTVHPTPFKKLPKRCDEPRKKYVFLGGACNPTTWRENIAIPHLDRIQIRYYNPQIDDWSPSLIDLENKAKEEASHLMFVISPETRGITTFLEITYYLGVCPERLIIVDLFTPTHMYNRGSAEENKDVNRGREYVLDFVKKTKNVKIYTDICKALDDLK